MGSESRRIEALLKGTAESSVRKLQLGVWQSLTSATPVDTGFARAGWTPSTGSPVADRLDAPPTKDAARSQGSQRQSANMARALNIASTYKLEQGQVFITNAVPYIVFLNEGSSSQAPSKFVERAINAAIRSLGIA